VAVGVVVLLAAGGGAMRLLNRPGEPAALRAADTTHPLERPSSTPVDTIVRASSRPRETAATTTRRLDAAAVDDLLMRLIEAPPEIAVDSATLVYNTPGVSRKDRAFAACLAAQHERALGNTRRALAWADSGLALDQTLTACRSVVQEFRGGAEGT
jgi:hypothetical protein